MFTSKDIILMCGFKEIHGMFFVKIDRTQRLSNQRTVRSKFVVISTKGLYFIPCIFQR